MGSSAVLHAARKDSFHAKVPSAIARRPDSAARSGRTDSLSEALTQDARSEWKVDARRDRIKLVLIYGF